MHILTQKQLVFEMIIQISTAYSTGDLIIQMITLRSIALDAVI